MSTTASFALRAALTDLFKADSVLASLCGADTDGKPAIFPYHHRDVVDPVYPLITVDQFGVRMDSKTFEGSDFALSMEAPRFAICVWSKQSQDECDAIYRRILELLKTQPFALGDNLCHTYTWYEKHRRTDLFDTEVKAYHYHSEWDGWVRGAS